jgi:hypothetical protein
VTFYGLADYRLNDFGEVLEFYGSREEAEAALRDVLRDEPEWEGELGVVTVEFAASRSSTEPRSSGSRGNSGTPRYRSPRTSMDTSRARPVRPRPRSSRGVFNV